MKNLITYLPKKSLSPDNGSGMDRGHIGFGSAFSARFSVALLMLFSLGIGSAWGGEETFSPSSSIWSTTGEAQSYTHSGSGITLATSSGCYNSSNTDLRVYKDYTFTVSISSGNITAISMTGVSGNPISGYSLTSGGGTFTTDGYNGSWSGTSSEIVFTASTKQVRMKSITVTYASACGGTKLGTPVVTATPSSGKVVLTWPDVTNASSYQLKWNGGDWTAASSGVQKTGLTDGTTYTYQVKAIGNGSLYCDGDASASASVVPGTYYTVTWTSNGSTHATSSVRSGTKPTFPSTPTSCDTGEGASTTFYGWTTSTWDGKIDDISAKTIYTSAGDMPNISGAVEYHAVFAKGAAANTYVKGTSSQLAAGQTILIVNHASSVAFSTGGSASGWTAVSVSPSDNKITTTNSAILFTLEAGTNGFYLKQGSSYLNVWVSQGGTHYIYYDGDTDDWTISGSGPYVLRSTNKSDYRMQYNGSVFTVGTGSSGNAYEMDFYIPATPSKFLTTCVTCETAPTVGAPSNSSVSVNTATVSCSEGITKGSCDISEYGFYYGTTNGVTTSNATKHKVGDGTAGNNVSSYSWNMTSLTANTHYYVKAYAIAGGTTTLSTNQTDFTTCKAAAPNHVDITPTAESGNYGYRYTIGETIKLTATAYATSNTSSPIASGNITGYQWQKYVGSEWVNLTNGTTDGVTISGATTANLSISNCKSSNTGSYACVIRTGASCSTASDGYRVRVYTLDGAYYGDDDTKNAIVWTNETTGTVTLSLNASKTYMFKVTDNDGKWYGREANNFIIEPWQQNCNTENQKIRLFTGPAGTYTFTIDITNAQAGTPVVNVKVEYPDVTHPVTGYMYVPKWWTCYPHWWDGSGNALTSDGSDPAITKYTEICDEDYWYMPVLDNYVNIAVKDNATWKSASNNSGNQTTTDHSGMMLTNDGSWKWQSFTTYTITYAKGDGTGDAMATSSGICPSADQDLTANSYTAPSHKHFSGWKTNTALTYVAYGDDDDGTHEVAVAVNGIVPDRAKIKEVGGNITLTAQWAYNTTTVMLKKNGGTGNNQTVLATYGSAMPLTTTSDVAIAVHTKAGHALLGYWDTDASTGGNQYYSYDGSTLSSYANWDKDDASIDLYARWEEKVDQFIDDLHETSGYTSASPHEESGAGYTVPGPLANGDKNTGNDCRKAHYVFVGWVISGGQNANGTIKGTPKIWQPGESNNASGATYYAVWAEDVE